MPHYVHPSFPQNGDQSLQPSPVVDAISNNDQHYQEPPATSRTARAGLGAAKPSKGPPTLPSNIPRTQMTWVETTVPLAGRCSIELRCGVSCRLSLSLSLSFLSFSLSLFLSPSHTHTHTHTHTHGLHSVLLRILFVHVIYE